MEEGKKDSKDNLKEGFDKAKNVLDTVTEKAFELAGDTGEQIVDIVEDAKDKVSVALSDESIQNMKEKASELASEASEHIADFAEDAQEELKEATIKTKNFFQRLFGK